MTRESADYVHAVGICEVIKLIRGGELQNRIIKERGRKSAFFK